MGGKSTYIRQVCNNNMVAGIMYNLTLENASSDPFIYRLQFLQCRRHNTRPPLSWTRLEKRFLPYYYQAVWRSLHPIMIPWAGACLSHTSPMSQPLRHRFFGSARTV